MILIPLSVGKLNTGTNGGQPAPKSRMARIGIILAIEDIVTKFPIRIVRRIIKDITIGLVR
jgi:hypothetical protein